MIKIISKSILLLSVMVFLILPNWAHAQTQQWFSCVCNGTTADQATCTDKSAVSFSEVVCPSDACVVHVGRCATPNSDCSKGDCVKLENPLKLSDNKISVPVIIARIISTVLKIIGSLALVMVLKGAYDWLTAAGNAEKIKAGQKTIFWAMAGVFIVLGSYLLINGLFSFIFVELPPDQTNSTQTTK